MSQAFKLPSYSSKHTVGFKVEQFGRAPKVEAFAQSGIQLPDNDIDTGPFDTTWRARDGWRK